MSGIPPLSWALEPAFSILFIYVLLGAPIVMGCPPTEVTYARLSEGLSVLGHTGMGVAVCLNLKTNCSPVSG